MNMRGRRGVDVRDGEFEEFLPARIQCDARRSRAVGVAGAWRSAAPVKVASSGSPP